ncbi:MAG: 4-(cytidine 5'-diphospho)-2-C-methyl-D-erythritol kinase [Burkholderiales bacterium]|nr:4-(cytidine 5'-diphospho)-2-C-methyl-D-erythritol kinase [Burkholderiales bacterium]
MSALAMHGLAGFPAPAKLNLMLRVLGRRADGYHLLQTVFRFIDYGDTVRLRVRQDGIIARVQPLPGISAAEDLTVRAARALQAATGTPLGVDIAIDKRLPVGGGLGGGSSDAATTLLALNHLWHTGLTRKRLQELALPLGADVPAFVFGQTACAGGVGEVLAPLTVPPAWYLVLVPAVAVSTAGIFQHPELKRDAEPIKMQGFSVPAGNDLEPLVCRLYPEVARHLAWLKSVGGAQMTGSGACVFATFADEAGARQALATCPADMRGFVARGLDVHPLHGLADLMDE